MGMHLTCLRASDGEGTKNCEATGKEWLAESSLTSYLASDRERAVVDIEHALRPALHNLEARKDAGCGNRTGGVAEIC